MYGTEYMASTWLVHLRMILKNKTIQKELKIISGYITVKKGIAAVYFFTANLI